MSRIAYVNGRYLPRREAKVDIEDRGYQFSDGVYEVCEVRAGRLVDESLHMARLRRSLHELRIPMPASETALGVILRETLRRNRVHDGMVYFYPPGMLPSLVVTAKRLDFDQMERAAAAGIAVITLPDNRWARVDIKSISLLPNVLAKQAAREQGAKEAWFVDKNGFVTEGSSTNAWIVSREGKVVTRPADHGVLRGVTRKVLLGVIKAQGLELDERPFTVEEAYAAHEAFVTSASQTVMPVVRIDGKPVGNGAPGLLAGALRWDFHRYSAFS
jgi:D-alanine transaminase